MEPPPNMNRTAVQTPLPTPPTQVHDAFHEKEASEFHSKSTGEREQSSPMRPQEEELYTPQSTIFKKRSYDEAFDATDEGNLATSISKNQEFHGDFALFTSISSRLQLPTPRKHAAQVAREESVDTDGSNEERGDNTPDLIPDVATVDAAESARRKEAAYRVWELRHPVVTPVEMYRQDPVSYRLFLINEAKETKELQRQEIERRNAMAKKNSKASPTTASKPKNTKRRRIEERENTPVVPKERPERDVTRLRIDVTITRQASDEGKLASPPVTPKKPRKEVGRSATPVKTTPKKKVAKVAKVIKRKPGKPGGINEHMDAIKSTLNTRLEKAGKAKQKNAPELFEDAYIPPFNLDGRRLVDPSREVQPKPLDVNDPCYNQLHPIERTLAERIRATPSEYTTQKRRYFLGLGEWWRLGHESVNPSHAQSFCNQDGNNTSYMHRVYDDWGWSKRSLWSDELLEKTTPLTTCEPWTRK